MSNPILNDLQSYAASLVERHQIPAISIAIWHGNKLHKAATGILNVDTGVEATTDSVFQIGSITKVFTASLVMQLVESGKVDLDRPVKDYLRNFRVLDPKATQGITIRQLLCHSGGFEGDLYVNDTNESGNPIERYVDRCSLSSQIHASGRAFSYSNAGFAILGRLVEITLGMSFFEAVEEHIYNPLGMNYAVAHPMNTLRYRSAMGHFPNPGDPAKWSLAPICYACMGLAPAGRLSMSAPDLITFARTHLNQGRTEYGQQWLLSDTISAMQQPQVNLPPYSPSHATDWGLGWSLANKENKANQANKTIIGHSGQTFGQSALLRLIPEENTAFAVLANVGGGGVMAQVFDDLLFELADIKYETPQILRSIKKTERFIGRFESLGYRYCICLENQRLIATVEDKVLLSPKVRLVLKPISGNSFASFSEEGKFAGNISFLNADNSSTPGALYAGYRLIRRV